MKYLIETHFHTSEVSPCGDIPAAEGIKLYAAAGYSGIMTTDHISTDYMTNSYKGDTWKDKVDYYLRGYRAAAKAAPDGFSVMLGMELRFEDCGNDYLIFGLTEDFLYANEWFTRIPLHEFSKLAKKENLTIVQAHPFRENMKIVNPRRIDGMEVFNGNRRHDSNDAIAYRWAKRHKLIMTSGSDFHELEDLARGGIITEELPKTSKDLRRILLGGNYEIKSLSE